MPWLQAAPSDFAQQVRELRGAVSHDAVSHDKAMRLYRLAQHALDESQLGRLAEAAKTVFLDRDPRPFFISLKLGVFGDGTLSLLAPAIAGSGLRHRLVIDTVAGNFNRGLMDALDPSGPAREAGLDMALIVSDFRVLGLDRAAASRQAAEEKVERAFEQIVSTVEALRPSVASTIFVQTLAPPLEPLFGSFDRVEAGAAFSMIAALNSRVANWAREGSIVLIDVARLAATVGYEAWDDPPYWHSAKLSFAPSLLSVYGDLVARTIAAARGLSRKCLVLDLDNTLWGGVIGDDGLAGIQLGQGSAAGEAFLAVQRMALELRARGVILAVCSKNEDDNARVAFREHPEMLLKEDHFAVFQANWTDKAANLRAIAETLHIGLDALVLLDDNPAERLQVRRELPLVAVPELPDDPALYPRTLACAGYFEAIAFSKEDRDRAAYYDANVKRAAVLQASADIGAYLASLEMICTIDRVDAAARPRVAQLINKSNQFNLTTRRYSEAEVAAAARDPSRHVVQVRLVDRFGDNGIISVLIADKKGEAWEIDTWLMSCRVLGRRVEEACLAHLVAAARLAGARELLGCYIPSPKNRIVKDHYRRLGFTPAGEAGHAFLWRLRVDEFRPPALEMTVEDRVVIQETVSP